MTYLCSENKIKPRMKIKFYNDIVSEEERVMMEWNGINNAVSFQSVKDLLELRPSDDNEIDLAFNCRGGLTTEGWAIYDLLRQQAGANIKATIEGQCSSMASVILLAAPKENRKAYQNACLWIHNPYVQWLNGEYREAYTADDITRTAEKLTIQAEALAEEQKKILAVYVERTGTDAETLQALMDKDSSITAEQAMELGFISEIIAPVTAKNTTPSFGATNKNIKDKMSKQTETKASRFDKIMLALKELVGLADAPEMVALQITAADGSVLEIDREEGEPQVGDAATPDGSFTMEDGSTIIVEGGVITEITAPTTEESTENAETDAQDEPQDTAEPQDEPQAEETANENEELKSKIADLESELEELKKKLADAEANEKDAEDKAVLEMVAKAGGKDAVEQALAARSSYNASNPKGVNEKGTKDNAKNDALAFGDSYIEEKRKAFIEARAKMNR